jgi:hypothetical protein
LTAQQVKEAKKLPLAALWDMIATKSKERQTRMIGMSNHERLFNWWWSPDGPRAEDPLPISEIAALLTKARDADVVQGRQGKTISQGGWNYAVLKFLIEYCRIIPPEVRQKLVALANPKTGNFGRWRDFGGCSTEITRPSTAVHMTHSSVPAHVHGPAVVPPDEKLPDVHGQCSLRELIAVLQRAVAGGGINREALKHAVNCLSELGYRYDSELFPDIENMEGCTDSIGKSPSNLAEALLWKLGKWKSYRKFTGFYAGTRSGPTQTDVVFYAFARHLKDRSNPIYDQHAMRALWAICGNLTGTETSRCKSILFNGHDKWKKAMSGPATIKCYATFTMHIRTLMIGEPGPSLTEVDRLLMPLGKAIKKTTTTYAEFRQLCGWPNND